MRADLEKLLAAAVDRFAEAFARKPRFAAAAPGRINLIGEHTDYNDGFVLPIAIDRWAVVVADRSPRPMSRFLATDRPESDLAAAMIELDLNMELHPQPARTWVNYPLGVIDGCRTRGWRVPAMDFVLTSSIPIGAGLSSSAAITVAAATLLESMTGASISSIEKAQLCQHAEHTFAGSPCGIMDMFISAAAIAEHALLIDCRTLEAQAIPLPPPDAMAMLVIDTGVQHAIASGEYAERRATCAEIAHIIGVKSLRDATLAMLDHDELTELHRRRASHVIMENARTLLAARAMQMNDLSTLSNLLFASHDSLRILYEVSCPELDCIVDAARSADTYGARMTGGGFGGCAIALCPPDSVNQLSTEIVHSFQNRFQREPKVFSVHSVGAAQSIAIEI